MSWKRFLTIRFLREFVKNSFLASPDGSEGKASACNAGDPGMNPELGRPRGEENGNSSILA